MTDHILDPRKPRGVTPEQTAKAKLLRQRELGDLKVVLSTKEGRRFFWGLMQRSKIFDEAMTGNANTYYIIGMQDLGKTYFRDAHLAALKEYRLAEDEAQAERDEDKIAREKGL